MSKYNTKIQVVPKWMEKLFEWYCDDEITEEIQGDLYERFLSHVEKDGLTSARKKYLLNGLKFIMENLKQRSEDLMTADSTQEIKERMVITVDDDSTSSQGIIELPIVLNTLQSFEAGIITDLVHGMLECVIVQTSKPVDIVIALAEYPEIELLNQRQFMGSAYLPLRQNAISNAGERFNFVAERWALNNRLIVQIKGQRETETTFIVRYMSC